MDGCPYADFFVQNSMKFILGTKQAMTQLFDEKGVVHAVTILKAEPATVTQVKTKAIDGYSALQFGFGTAVEKKINKAQKPKGMFVRYLEVRTDEDPTLNVGDTISLVDAFSKGDAISVSGPSKAKGFQGGVKRHGFHGGPRTHGQKHNERSVGSIGGGARAGGRVAKGMRMSGRMGGERVTVKNLTVLDIDTAKNEIIVSGAVPGRRGTVIEVYAAK